MSALKIHLVLALLPASALLLNAQPKSVLVEGPEIRITFNDQMHTDIVGLTPASASETVTVQGREIADFTLRNHRSRKVTDAFGAGTEHILTGDAQGLRKQVKITSYPAFPGILILQARYTNTGKTPVTIDSWTNHH